MKGHISTVYAVLLQGANKAQPGGLCPRHYRKIPQGQKPYRQCGINLQQPEVVQHQAEPREVHLQGPPGKLLGYIITKRGIEANPDKISAIAKIGQVRGVKDI
jgi:hypothetical protein